MNLNAPPSPYPFGLIDQDHDQSHYRHLVGCNHQIASSASLSCHIFMNQNQTQDNHIQYYHNQLYQSGQHDQDQGGSSLCEIKNKVLKTSGLKLTLWKKESDHDHGREVVSETNFPMKWTSSKMRMRVNRDIITSATTKFKDEKLEPSSSSLSSNNSSYNYNSPIRVCSDCNTTKTPLWRSGPKGPKSLCNACGIRQRKARRTMAVAANITTIASCQPTAVKIKVQKKDQSMGINEHAQPLKKRCKMTVTSSTAIVGSDGQKLGFEDFLINLSKKLAFHRVFPKDEKDAAMLLMALSSGLIHG